MKGLEVRIASSGDISENKDQRFDSDFWTKEPYRNPELTYEPIRNHLTLSQYGVSISMNEDGEGVPIYRMNEIHDMLCDLSVDKCAELNPKEIADFVLKPRDVLFNRTNSYEWVGRTGLFRGCRQGPAVFASYLVRFRTKHETVRPEYLVAFLSSKFGVAEVKRRSRHSINQTNVNPEEVKEILIPLLGIHTQEKITALFDRASDHRTTSESRMSEAEQHLLLALGLNDWLPPATPTFSARASDTITAGRIDAQYFRPIFEEIERRMLATGNAIELGSVLAKNSRGRQPLYSETGLPVVNSKHVRTNRVLLEDNRLATELGSPVTIRKGDVLVNGTGVGTIGRAAPYLHEQLALPDNHVTVLRTDKVDPIYLSAFLNSQLGQWQIERHIKGSSGQIEIYPADIARIMIWNAPIDLQNAVRQSILSAFQEERRANSLLSAAKCAVEIAIEVGEVEANAYLDEQKEVN